MSVNASYRLSTVWQHHVTLGRSQNVMTLKPSRPNFSSPLGGDTLMQTRRTNGQRFTWNYNTSYLGAPSWMSSSLTVGVNGSMGDLVTLQGCQQNPVATSLIGCSTGGAPLVWLPMNDRSWGGFAQWQVG